MSTADFTKYNNPTIIVIFGGTGDLAQTKLIPALLDLLVAGALPDSFAVVGLSRKPLSDTDYQSFVRESIERTGRQYDAQIVNNFCQRFRYVAGSFTELTSYNAVKQVLTTLDDSIGQCTNKLFYLAVPPEHYEIIFTQLHACNIMKLCDGIASWSRLLVEKPFGKDLATAKSLEKIVCSLFADEQIYRIDHYLAKDAIENIISMRFANSIITDSWHSGAIESIDIRLLETKDVSNRGAFYDGMGVLRDVGQNHMLQILALLTMSPVDIHKAEAVRQARADALLALGHEVPDAIIRGQYDGYQETPGVAEASQTETYFKVSFQYTNKTWHGVRVTLEAGKALEQSVNEAIITFKARNDCNCAFAKNVHKHKNVLRIKFSPDQRITLSFWSKRPGFQFQLEEREFVLADTYGEDSYSPEAYERVLYDCIAGDQTRFVSGAEVEAAWRFISPILAKFSTLPLHQYATGSTGPTPIKHE